MMNPEIEQVVRAVISGLDGYSPQPFQNFHEARAHVDLADAKQGVAWWEFIRAKECHGRSSNQAMRAYDYYCCLSVPQAVVVARMMMTLARRKRDLRLKRRFRTFFGGSPAWDASIAADKARLACRKAGREGNGHDIED